MDGEQTAGRLITVRYDGVCVTCAAALPAKTEAWWFKATKTLQCQGCAPGLQTIALTDDPQSTVAWGRGGYGEKKVGQFLNTLRDQGCVVMHDRRVPGSTANIDHVVVCPAGVWVIDAKRYEGKVEWRNVGGFFRTDERLFVNGRDRTKLVTSVAGQVGVVRTALGPHADLNVRGMLCFVDGEWAWFEKPFLVRDIAITWPNAATEVLSRPGPLERELIGSVGRHLAEALPTKS